MMKLLRFAIALGVVVTLSAQTQSGDCKPLVLPLGIRNQISKEFPLWRIQEVPDLNPTARNAWEGSAHTGECPGIAFGHFDGGVAKSYAVLVVSRNHPKTGNQFLIFGRRAGKSSYQLMLAERSDAAEAGNFFVRGIQIGDFFNHQWIKRLGVGAKDGVLLVDAGEQEYEADVYYWTQSRYQHQPVDY
jgi:hypothetical protein